ncbi:CCDC174 family protein [Winogradskyella alexanderae]|uniref:CCDC174 family protein n=1 Tax=Winogradskyella alexanderae TaxID=2877123 RepID=A0ABS7XPR0_9FLAO|nr:CCDC174 family protein [Winogradskyella alexanderae]MCA0132003.1 CCDC174 family protein [Winogradskyella alexanderae]
MNTIKILALCLITSIGFAQNKMTKTSQSIKVNKDVVVDLNTNYVEIEIDTWNRDIVEIEAYIESNVLSDEDLERALEAWNLDISGTNDKVVITSTGGKSVGLFGEADYADLLKDLEYRLADLPEIPELASLPNIPEMEDMPPLPKIPEMPEFPELPEIPNAITTIKFDYDRYKKEGEKYLQEWSKKYEKEGGKELRDKMEQWAKDFADSGFKEKMEKWGEEYGMRFDKEWAKDMEKWGEKFGEKYAKDMEKWSEEFGEKLGKEWAEKMEAWGERFGKEWERKAQQIERDAERQARLAEREATIAERTAERATQIAERKAEMEERRKEMKERREVIFAKRFDSGSNSKIKKVIKIKIPKKAKLKTNIRHGELKLSSVIHNMSGDISHSFLVAENIDGGDTSINVSYSPVIIDSWNVGTLTLNFVDKAQIKNVNDLILNAKSSNINIEQLSNTGIIDGSFGDLTISNLSETFRNLNLVLENSDAYVNLPKNTSYSLHYKGNRSKYNNEPTNQKTIRNYPEGSSTDKTIIVNAKYSNVIID